MNNENQTSDVLRCYFFGISPGKKDDEKAPGLSGFAIPDLGILYKNRCRGTLYECQYNGLLILLRFIESNKKSLREFELEIHSDAAVVVYQLLHHKSVSQSLMRLYNAAVVYQSKIAFRMSWVPSRDNPALSGLLETPPLKSDIEIRFDDKKSANIERLGKGNLWF